MSDNTKFGAAKGMRDWLPKDTLLRQDLIRLIERCYQLYGFQPVDTPALENIEVLQGKGGGENEKLMFKVMKRGQEFVDVIHRSLLLLSKRKQSSGFDDNQINDPGSFPEVATKANEVREEFFDELNEFIPDLGLRFDLTVPLARYYANHANELPKPFRCSHIGPVWRADRPQKGRYREFYQCDIDIVGGASDAYEVELLLATDRVLKQLGVGKFKIRISDKRLLNEVLTGFGVEASKIGPVAMAIDKLDKQPFDQVWKEIEALGHSTEAKNQLEAFIKGATHGHLNHSHFQVGEAEALFRKVEDIRHRVLAVNSDASVVFDPLLVRGFDYYTGPVFEINVEDKDFTFSIGGGGRYDGLIEKLGGPKGTPAVGISLGFERILLILAEKNKNAAHAVSSSVYIANNGQQERELLIMAEELRSKGIQVEVCLEKKDFIKQLKAAQEAGFEFAITEFKHDSPTFKVRRLSTRQDKEMSVKDLQSALNAGL